MILKNQRSMWSFQWFIILLFNRVRYSPISIRQWYRIDVDVIPLSVSSSGFRSHHNRVIGFNFNVPILRQISQTQIWDPGLLRLKLRLDPIVEDAETRRAYLVRYFVDWVSNFSGSTNVKNLRIVFSRRRWITIPKAEDVVFIQSPGSVYQLTSLMASTLFVCRFAPLRLAEPVSITSLWVGWIQLPTITALMVTGTYLFLRKRLTMYGEIDLFFLVLVLEGETFRMRIRRIRRSKQQYVWVYGTITKIYISFFKRVPRSRVLRCNGWIADFAFRKRKRWYIDKKQMFPKLESHTRSTDKTRATKHIIRIAAPKLFCFFVTKIIDCIFILMFNITIFGSY